MRTHQIKGLLIYVSLLTVAVLTPVVVSPTAVSAAQPLDAVTQLTSNSTQLASIESIIQTIQQTLNNITSKVADLAGSSQLAQAAPTNGLVGHWTFDEGAGTTAKDSSGNGNNGTLVNGPTWVKGKIGGALSFDGTNTTKVVANTVSNMTKFTSCVWVKPYSLTNKDVDSFEYILNKGFMLRFSNSGVLSFRIPTSGSYSSVNSSVNIATGIWQNICIVNYGIGVSPNIYINGKDSSVGGYGGSGSQNSNTQTPLIFGSSSNDYYGNFNGAIDDARIYSRALTPTEIANVYSASNSTTQNTAPPKDITPPTLSNGSPTTTLQSGTTSTTLSITTNENATCKYSKTAGNLYSAMANIFTITGGTTHSTTVTNLTDGTSYNYYIRCQDTAGNPTSSDYAISYSVSSAPTQTTQTSDTTPPSTPTSLTSTSLSSSAISLSWNVSTDSIGVAGYKIYRNSKLVTNTTNTTYTDINLTPNTTYLYSVSAYDVAGNNSSQSAKVTMTTLTLVPSPVSKTYWVSKNGNDLNNCLSKSSACSSIQKGLSLVSPGDTLDIERGVYVEDSSNSKYTNKCVWMDSFYASLCVEKDGTKNNPITIQAAPGDKGKVIIDSKSLRVGLNVGNHDYIHIKDLNFINNRISAITSWGQVQNRIADESKLSIGVVIEGNYIYNTGGPYGYNIAGIHAWGTKNWIIKNNRIDKTFREVSGGASGIQAYGIINALIENNYITNSTYGIFWKDHFVNADGTPIFESEIKYNRIDASGAPINIGIRGAGSPEDGINYIHNNIFYGYSSSKGGIDVGLSGALYQSSGLRVENNIFDGSNSIGSIAINADSYTNSKFKGNIFIRNDLDFSFVKYSSNTKMFNLIYSNYNIFDSGFKSIIDRYSSNSKSINSLSVWQGLLSKDYTSLGVDNPDQNSITSSASSLFIDVNNRDYTYKTTSPAIGLIPDGSNAGPYQYGNEVIGLLPSNLSSNKPTPAPISIPIPIPVPVPQPPTITALTGTTSTTVATITFKTNKSALTQINYGLSTNYTNVTTYSVGTVHTVTLSNLSSNTTYNYQIIATDQAGNKTTSINYTFKTKQAQIKDTTPPAKTTSLKEKNTTQTSTTLTWTAPGDDNMQGTASSYDIRYSITPLTNTNWTNATQTTGEPTPHKAGQTETPYTTVGLTPNTTYYFGLKAKDEANNTSSLSNILKIITLNKKTPPTTTSGGGSSYIQTVQHTSGGEGMGGGYYIDATPPSQVKDTEVQPADKQITLTWVNPKNTDFARTVIVRKEGSKPTSKTDGIIVYDGTEQKYTDINLNNNKTYYYAIYTHDKKPNYSKPVYTEAQPQKGKTSIESTIHSGLSYTQVQSILSVLKSFGVDKATMAKVQQALQGVPFVSVINSNTATTHTPIDTVYFVAFRHTLYPGLRSDDVTRLQRKLSKDNSLYPEGIITGYYGSLTVKAVKRFQKKYHIVSSGSPYATGYGLVGPRTRKELNLIGS